jgi:salicylate hydroxylase
MSPQQASGAGQAIEDAFILSTLLGHKLTNASNIETAIQIYDTVRRPIAEEVADRSLGNGRLFGLQLPGFDADKAPERLPEIGEAVKENWSWGELLLCLVYSVLTLTYNFCSAWTTTIDNSVEKAVSMLESALTETRAHL